MSTTKILSEIRTLASENQEVIVAWLYGSRARNTAHQKSDFDIAIAFEKPINNVLDNRLRPEVLALQWQQSTGAKLSILDINIAPIPIAMTVVDDDHVLFGEDTARRYMEEQRIMSMWDDYQYQVLQYA